MSDKLNGTLMIGGFAADNTGRKVFDLKITNTWPILSIDRNHPQFVQNDQGLLKQLETPNQHLSIPPDLNVHLSPTRNFLHRNLVNGEGDLMVDFINLFGWFSYPIEFYRQPKGTWHGAELFFLTPDKHFTSKTGIFVELFAHKNENALHEILSEPFINKTMRCISYQFAIKKYVTLSSSKGASLPVMVRQAHHDMTNVMFANWYQIMKPMRQEPTFSNN